MAELGEFGVIDRIAKRLPAGAGVLLGPGDDAAVVSAPDSRVVATTDLLVEGRHFRRDWSAPYDVGRKAAAQSLADVAAMGAVPTAVLVGLAGPGELPVEWATALADGLREECGSAGAAVVGGDLVRSATLTIAVTALGSMQGRDPVTRSGARPGDAVAVAGRLGWAAAGFSVLSRGFRSPRVLVEAHRRPSPPYEQGPVAAEHGATAMIDVSDGLVQDLGHIARESGVLIDIASGVFEIPEVFQDTARALSADPLIWLLSGGEDHALAACFPGDAGVPEGWLVIGRVTEGDPAVHVDGTSYDGPAGWQAFSG